MLADYISNLSTKIEPEAADHDGGLSDDRILAMSTAISLKRIADVLTGEGFAQLFMHPINHYGEGVSDAIQNSIERGLRGMNTRG